MLGVLIKIFKPPAGILRLPAAFDFSTKPQVVAKPIPAGALNTAVMQAEVVSQIALHR
jgi:hypothetical protein